MILLKKVKQKNLNTALIEKINTGSVIKKKG